MRKALEIIEYFQPAKWWLETPATGLLAKSEMMAGYPYIDVDQCQFSDFGYQKPTRFFGSDHLRSLKPVLCDQRTCRSLVEDPDGGEGKRKHKNRQGGENGFVKRKLAYRIPPTMVEYVTGLSAIAPKPKCKGLGARWSANEYAVQQTRVREIIEGLQVRPTVDAFSESTTARFERWWGPGSLEAEDAFEKLWTDELLWINPPFGLYYRVLDKLVKDKAHAVLIMPEWPNQSFYTQAKALEIASMRFDCNSSFFETSGRPLPYLRWPVQAILVCGDRGNCPCHGGGDGHPLRSQCQSPA